MDKGFLLDFYYVFNDFWEKECLFFYCLELLVVVYGFEYIFFGVLVCCVMDFLVIDFSYRMLKFILKVYNCGIFVRDFNCFYNFKDGICLCGDYW